MRLIARFSINRFKRLIQRKGKNGDHKIWLCEVWSSASFCVQEQTSISALRAVWRIFKPNSKTLGNKSSTLPFKAKIDILYDLGELDSTNYNHLIKLMEIRNRFAHNPNAVSFSSFEEINKDIFKYLLKYKPQELEKEEIENQLEGSFNELFKIIAGKLLVVEIEYANDAVVENFDQIWGIAVEKMNVQQMPVYRFLSTIMDEKELDRFYNYFQMAMLEFCSAELGKVDIEKGEVFKTKQSIKEHVAWLKKKQANLKMTKLIINLLEFSLTISRRSLQETLVLQINNYGL